MQELRDVAPPRAVAALFDRFHDAVACDNADALGRLLPTVQQVASIVDVLGQGRGSRVAVALSETTPEKVGNWLAALRDMCGPLPLVRTSTMGHMSVRSGAFASIWKVAFWTEQPPMRFRLEVLTSGADAWLMGARIRRKLALAARWLIVPRTLAEFNAYVRAGTTEIAVAMLDTRWRALTEVHAEVERALASLNAEDLQEREGSNRLLEALHEVVSEFFGSGRLAFDGIALARLHLEPAHATRVRSLITFLVSLPKVTQAARDDGDR